MPSLLLRNLSGVVTGDWRDPLRQASSIYVEDGVIREIGDTCPRADTVIDARGLLAIPGLIDSHVHPSFGDFTPTQNSVGWMQAYLHGGVTTLVSAGELHIPGLPLDPPDPRIFKYLAVLSKRCSANLPQKGPHLLAGTLLLAPGLTEADFDELAQEGCRLVKFIFYPYGDTGDEAERYVRWCHERGIVVKMHTGGVSRSGVSRPAGYQVVKDVRPDIAAHITGGPIPMPMEEMEAVVRDLDVYLEVCIAGSFRHAVRLMEVVREVGAQGRVILGTDTPSGTGISPRGMLRNIALLASLGGVPPEVALCMATGDAAIAHRLDMGFLQEGRPADLVLIGRIGASAGRDVLHAISLGDIPGISTVVVNGEVVVHPRSEQTPPPERVAVVERGG